MKEVQGWTEDGDELALLISKPHFKKHSNGHVDILVNMVIKQLIAMKEKQI